MMHSAAVPSWGIRTRAAISLGSAAARLSRAAGRGEGSTIGGRVTLAIAPEALRELASGRHAVVVTGTNGKSTTTAMITAALGADLVCTNTSGANMPAGLVTTLAGSAAPTAVLEVDELWVPAVMDVAHPQVVVLLNLSRDQLDRSHEVGRIAGLWHTALERHPSVVVANAADPQVTFAAEAAGASVVWVRPPGGWRHDSTVCSWCGAPLQWTEGQWWCTCGQRQRSADVWVSGTTLHSSEGDAVELALGLPGEVNLGNAACAVAAARAMGVPLEAAAERVATVSEVAGRYAAVHLGARTGQLLLAKNPAGWRAVLDLLPDDAVVAIGVNSQAADGRDTSWLWDVPFETFAGRRVGCFGDRAADLALRLSYAGASPVGGRDLPEIVGRLPEGRLAVIANYTAFQEVRHAA